MPNTTMASSITINPAALLTLVPQPASAIASDGESADKAVKARPRIDPRTYSVSETSDAAWREALDQWRARLPAR
jgi:hypothetical protein